ncbi:unnamed protein product, partial [Meganyctiphanes norvegica]
RLLNATTTTITYGRSDTLTQTTIDLALNHLGQIVKCPSTSLLTNTNCPAGSSLKSNKNPSGSSLLNPRSNNTSNIGEGKINRDLVIKNPENLPDFILKEDVDVNIVKSFFSEDGWAAVEDIIRRKREKRAEALFRNMTNGEKQEKILSWLVPGAVAKQLLNKSRLENIQADAAEIVLSEIN